ncbi:endonuclease domain of the non-ltr retrotransposon line-1 [Plakobranchus ocellatus]|uniref:Endonuclease domain of the non-ltr retrotransposon line-1 n=1 Tax=Plakobranchus ocellatus TaxID=259542 RepID=A0AAV4CP15_9GAST|nr:endonuclease domain of the non-ltr retrotransposon line-1 [Plakobranchus ocellatus]
MDLSVNSIKFTLGCVYGPNRDEPSFYQILEERIKLMQNQNLIIVGDWNLLLDPDMDGENYLHIYNPRARQAMHKLISNLNLIDVWRDENLESKKYTWRRLLSNKSVQKGRLDLFRISESLQAYVVKPTIELGYRSDHSSITLSLKLRGVTRSKTFWKFNNTLL